MKPHTDQTPLPARALAPTAAADSARAREIAALRLSIERIFTLMSQCDDAQRKIRLNATLFAATRDLAALLRQ